MTLAAIVAALAVGFSSSQPAEPGESAVDAAAQQPNETPQPISESAEAPESSSDEAEPPETAEPSEEEPQPEPEPEPEPKPPRPEPAPPSSAPTDYNPDSAGAPGGYWGLGEGREIPPKDGQQQILAGTITAPLGLLTTISASASLYLTMPGHCQQRMRMIGAHPSAEQCEGLLILNAIRVGYGVAALGAGVALLAIGLHRRKQYRLWKKRHFQSSQNIRPTVSVDRRAWAAGLRLRF